MSGYIHNLGPAKCWSFLLKYWRLCMKRVKMHLISLGVAATMAIGFLLINFSGVVAGEKSENINAGEISELPDEEYVLPYGISIKE